MTIFLSSTIPLTYILKESATFRSSHTKEEKDPPSAYQGSQKKSDKMSVPIDSVSSTAEILG